MRSRIQNQSKGFNWFPALFQWEKNYKSQHKELCRERTVRPSTVFGEVCCTVMGIPALLNSNWPAVEVYLSSWTRVTVLRRTGIYSQPRLNKAAGGS